MCLQIESFEMYCRMPICIHPVGGAGDFVPFFNALCHFSKIPISWEII
jgi:hypothetical protein